MHYAVSEAEQHITTSIKLDKPDLTLWFRMQISYGIWHRGDDSDRLQIQDVPKNKPKRPKTGEQNHVGLNFTMDVT